MSQKKSSRNNLGAFAGLFLAGGLSACTDYLKHRDTITLAAGDAQDWNRVVQTIDPWPPYARNTRIASDGQRIERVIRSYSNNGISGNPAVARPRATNRPASDNGPDGTNGDPARQ